MEILIINQLLYNSGNCNEDTCLVVKYCIKVHKVISYKLLHYPSLSMKKERTINNKEEGDLLYFYLF